jgi:5-formyltetrahydrofolate cyclo-ligase
MLHTTRTKADLRATALARRAALGAEARREQSARAVDHVRPLLRQGETVALFWPMRDEIDPSGLIEDVRALQGRVVLPAIADRRIVFRLFSDEDSLEPGGFGTVHPKPEQPALDPDLIVAPLAAFDRRGGRIGYGAGYYDRAIAELRARAHPFRLVGIAFACQEVDAVPLEAHDATLPLIATEDGLIRTEAA